jgi:hypothetical protein
LRWSDICHLIGSSEDDTVGHSIGRKKEYIEDFLLCLLGSPSPITTIPAIYWDLNRSNPDPLAIDHTGRADHIQITKFKCHQRSQVLYKITPLSVAHDSSWFVVTPGAASALECVRRGLGPQIDCIVEFFVQRGIPFYTLTQLLPSDEPSLRRLVKFGPIPTIGLGFRPQNYTPSQADYAIYEATRDSYLKQRHARAALLKGGIVWRLAIESISSSNALMGPSLPTAGMSDGSQMNAIFLHEDGSFFDDDLTSDEMDLICGVYRIYTGDPFGLSFHSDCNFRVQQVLMVNFLIPRGGRSSQYGTSLVWM